MMQWLILRDALLFRLIVTAVLPTFMHSLLKCLYSMSSLLLRDDTLLMRFFSGNNCTLYLNLESSIAYVLGDGEYRAYLSTIGLNNAVSFQQSESKETTTVYLGTFFNLLLKFEIFTF